MIISFISQKGGVGKSTLSQAFSVEAARKFNVLLIDCDVQQETSRVWNERRFTNKITPNIKVLTTDNLSVVSREIDNYDIVVIDGPAHTSDLTIQLAKMSDIVIQPSGVSLADLHVCVLEFNSLIANKVEKNKLFIALNQVPSKQMENKARNYLAQTDFKVLESSLSFKAGYVSAQDEGRAITEVRYPNLKAQAKEFIKSVIKKINI